jgi:hypothetical protein
MDYFLKGYSQRSNDSNAVLFNVFLNARQMHKKYEFGEQKSRVTKCDFRYNFNQVHQREYVSYDKCRRGHTSVDTYS